MNYELRKIKAREKWLKIYKETGSVTKTSLRCGIARSTLYTWIKRYYEEGVEQLSDKSHRPHRLANLKVTENQIQLILKMRRERNWGSQRISNHLLRTQNVSLSNMTIWRILHKNNVPPITKSKRKTGINKYNMLVPGERVQMDTTKLVAGKYQFTAIDDCTRLQVLRVYHRKTAANAVSFLSEVIEDFGFPIQRVQTDWGTEFFNYNFQYELHEHFIKFRPIRPRSPHLNGKVERVQQTDKTEFWSLLELRDKNLDFKKLAKSWQAFYNYKRLHSSLQGKTPNQKLKSVEQLIPLQGDVTIEFWNSTEEIHPRNSEFLKWKKKQLGKTRR